METPPPLGPEALITSPGALAALVDRLAAHPRLAVDTEAASFHRYVDRVYLVQVSTDEETALIDPLAVTDLTPLGRCLEDPAIEIVLHDADYDLRILDRDYGFRARNVFDTRIAAQLAGEPSVGLGTLLAKYFGVDLDKKLQRADWSRRPLPPEMLIYAAEDTRYLPELRDRLEQHLGEMGRLEWAREEFARLETIRWTGPTADDRDAYLRVRGAKALRSPRARAVLRSLYAWRDATARALDRAPFRVVGNDTLLALSRAMPRDDAALKAVPGVPRSVARRHGKALVEAVREGLATPREELPEIRRSPRPPSDPAYDARLERLKRLRNRRAEELGMDPGLVCPNGTLQALARVAPDGRAALNQISELRLWQRRVLREEAILAALQE